MSNQQVAPYGSWKSPVTSKLIVSEAVGLAQIAIDGDDIYWVEMRPQEGGRNVVVRWEPNGRASDVTPSPFNARTRVHEYGGGAYAVRDGSVYAVSFEDQRLYRFDPGSSEGTPITPEPGEPAGVRYADFDFGDGFLVVGRIERMG